MTQAIATTENLPALYMTFEEFLEWTDEHPFAEWVDGEVIPIMPVGLVHQRILRFLIMLLSHFVEQNQQGEILFAPFVMRLPLRPSGREPDLIFLTTENMSRLQKSYLDGAADLAVEIVSPESIERDYEVKKAEYAQNGVREYWCIDPEQKSVLFCQLAGEGVYREVTLSAGRYDSTTIAGFWLQVEWLWQEPLPLQEAMSALELLNLPNTNG